MSLSLSGLLLPLSPPGTESVVNICTTSVYGRHRVNSCDGDGVI